MKKWQLSLFISILVSSLISFINNSQNNFWDTIQNSIICNINDQAENFNTRIC